MQATQRISIDKQASPRPSRPLRMPWHAQFMRAYAGWRDAPLEEKHAHLLCGSLLAQAEDAMLGQPDRFNDDEKRFIVNSLSSSSGSASGEAAAIDPKGARNQTVLLLLSYFFLLLWIFAPHFAQEAMSASVQQRLNRDVVARSRAPDARPRTGAAASPAVLPPIAATKPEASRAEPGLAPAATRAEPPGRGKRRQEPVDPDRQRIMTLVERSRAQRQAGDARTSLLLAIEAAHETIVRANTSAGMAGMTVLFEALASKVGVGGADVAAVPRADAALCQAGDGLVAFVPTGDLVGWLRARPEQSVFANLKPAGLHNAAWDAACTQVALAVEDFAIEIWSPERPAAKHTRLVGHAGDIRAGAFSPDGQRLLTASQDGTARLWNLRAGRLDAVLGGHDDAVTAVAFAAGGRLAITGSADRTARVWDAHAGREVHRLAGHHGAVTSVLASDDGAIIATVAVDGFARVWDTRAPLAPRQLDAPGSSVVDARMSPDGRRLATLAQSGKVRIWDTGSGRPVTDLAIEPGQAHAIALSANGNAVATLAASGSAALWDARSGQRMATLAQAGMLQLAPGRGEAVVTMLSDRGELVGWPFVGTAEEAIAHAIEASAGECLTRQQRVALGLAPQSLPWCRDPEPSSRDTPAPGKADGPGVDGPP